MADHPLLTALASWPGRVSTQLAFEARGFAVHKAWQNRMIEFCGENQADLLNRYWDEVALETMRCAGKVLSETRYFGMNKNTVLQFWMSSLQSGILSSLHFKPSSCQRLV